MKSKRLMWITVMGILNALVISAWLAAQEQAAPPRYAVIDIGTGQALGINNRGWVTGGAFPGDTFGHAFLWKNGVRTDLGTFGGPNSIAGPLNELGEITISSDSSIPDPLGEDFCGFGTHLICPPLIWRNGVMIPLPTLGGSNGVTTAINNSGQVVGYAENTTLDPTCGVPELPEFKPVVWEKGEIRELATFPGDPDGAATGINDNGQIVGYSFNCTTAVSHALLWQKDGSVQNLGNLGGTLEVLATDINNRGQIVGHSSLPGDTLFHNFLWQDGLLTDLGTLPGDLISGGGGINNKGQLVVISCIAFATNCSACLFQNGAMTDLNTLIPADSPLAHLDADFAINSRGEIAGFTDDGHAYVAIPTHGEANITPAMPTAHDQAAHTGSRVKNLNYSQAVGRKEMFKKFR